MAKVYVKCVILTFFNLTCSEINVYIIYIYIYMKLREYVMPLYFIISFRVQIYSYKSIILIRNTRDLYISPNEFLDYPYFRTVTGKIFVIFLSNQIINI